MSKGGQVSSRNVDRKLGRPGKPFQETVNSGSGGETDRRI